MSKMIHRISTILVLAIGVLQLGRTFFVYHTYNDAAIMFAGAGLACMFVALLNMGLWVPGVTVLSRWAAAVANFFFFFWMVTSVWADNGVIRIIVALIGAAMVVSATFLNERNSKRAADSPVA